VEPRRDLVHIGSEYGGYVVPLELLDATATCYSCGVGEDVTFDLGLIDATGCTVYAFDPTPRAAAYAAQIEAAEPRFRFLPYGIWSSNERKRFFAPSDEAHVSHSIHNLQQTGDFFEAECLTLATIMGELGHDQIDLLKLDVEGAEFDILRNVVDTDIPIRVLCAEFHALGNDRLVLGEVRRLVAAGFVPVHTSALTATFVRER
jgi:FkbM family methyltransferase